MNVTEKQARQKLCPVHSAGRPDEKCSASDCMMWQFDVPMSIDAPDSYVSEPGPTGHCGLTSGDAGL